MNNILKRIFRSGLMMLLLVMLTGIHRPIITQNQDEKQPHQDFVIFFDLGDVLLATNKIAAFKQNPAIFIKNIIRHGMLSGPRVTQRLFEMMDHVTQLPRGTATATVEAIPMPELMCDWLCGKVDSEILVENIIKLSNNDKFFKSKTEAKLLKNAVSMMLPENLVKIQKCTNMLKVLQDCCKTNPARVCILSNWDKSSLALLKASFPEIFGILNEDQLFFSGELGCKKPDAQIYQLAAAKMGLDCSCCVLVDDQKTNTDGAQACGWKAILHTDANKTAKVLREEYNFKC